MASFAVIGIGVAVLNGTCGKGAPHDTGRVRCRQQLVPELEIPRSTALSWIRRWAYGWLLINHLDNVATLQKLVEFCAVEHNTVMPHSAFDGQTPDEMYVGRGEAVPDELAQKRREARSRRVEENRKMACSNCPRGSAVASEDIAA
jgi:putative transposase